MALTNGADSTADPHTADDGQLGSSGPDDVTITIRGSTAAKMLGRGDAEARIVKELADLSERLNGMEARAAERASRHDALSRTVQDLQEKVAYLGTQVDGQVGELRAEIARQRTDLDGHAFRAAQLPAKVNEMLGQIEMLQREVHPLSGRIHQVQMDLDGLRTTIATQPRGGVGEETTNGTPPDQRTLLDKLRHQIKTGAASNGWIKRLNGFWIW